MTDPWRELLVLGVPVSGLVGTVLGARISSRANLRAKVAETEAQKLATRAQEKANTSSAQDQLIEQLQQELERYRVRTDQRLDALEAENRGYRAFIGVQRDHMAEHGIPLPPWPDGLPR